MSRTPAAELSRLRVQHPGWRVEHSATGSGYSAHRREERAAPNFIYAPTLTQLGAALMEADGSKGGEDKAGRSWS